MFMCGYMLIEEHGLFAKLRCNVRTLLKKDILFRDNF